MKLLERREKLPEIPLIALIDILAILLIFFIVSTKFKSSRSVVAIDLPSVTSLSVTEVKEERVVLALDKEGKVTFNSVEVTIAELGATLKKFKEGGQQGGLELEADEQVKLQYLFQIWDALTEAGIEIKDVPARIRLPKR